MSEELQAELAAFLDAADATFQSPFFVGTPIHEWAVSRRKRKGLPITPEPKPIHPTMYKSVSVNL